MSLLFLSAQSASLWSSSVAIHLLDAARFSGVHPSASAQKLRGTGPGPLGPSFTKLPDGSRSWSVAAAHLRSGSSQNWAAIFSGSSPHLIGGCYILEQNVLCPVVWGKMLRHFEGMDCGTWAWAAWLDWGWKSLRILPSVAWKAKPLVKSKQKCPTSSTSPAPAEQPDFFVCAAWPIHRWEFIGNWGSGVQLLIGQGIKQRETPPEQRLCRDVHWGVSNTEKDYELIHVLREDLEGFTRAITAHQIQSKSAPKFCSKTSKWVSCSTADFLPRRPLCRWQIHGRLWMYFGHDGHNAKPNVEWNSETIKVYRFIFHSNPILLIVLSIAFMGLLHTCISRAPGHFHEAFTKVHTIASFHAFCVQRSQSLEFLPEDPLKKDIKCPLKSS